MHLSRSRHTLQPDMGTCGCTGRCSDTGRGHLLGKPGRVIALLLRLLLQVMGGCLR